MRKQPGHWLVKQEPQDYSWEDFVHDGRTAWTGVRNFQARNNLRSMKKGDCVLFYHTGEEKAAVGIAEVAREAYADPTAAGGEWVCVDLIPRHRLKRAVPLSEIKASPTLRDIALVKQSRLSVVPLTPKEFATIAGMT